MGLMGGTSRADTDEEKEEEEEEESVGTSPRVPRRLSCLEISFCTLGEGGRASRDHAEGAAAGDVPLCKEDAGDLLLNSATTTGEYFGEEVRAEMGTPLLSRVGTGVPIAGELTGEDAGIGYASDVAEEADARHTSVSMSVSRSLPPSKLM